MQPSLTKGATSKTVVVDVRKNFDKLIIDGASLVVPDRVTDAIEVVADGSFSFSRLLLNMGVYGLAKEASIACLFLFKHI